MSSPDEMDLSWLVDQVAKDGSAIVFDPKAMAKELIAYGETEAAERLVQLDADEIREAGKLAYKHYSEFSGARGPMLDTAICLGVVEFLEGKPRALRRKRRVYPKGKS